MKGILLAGGTGSRLLPLTRATSKQLLPIFDKPMVYYPLSTLMLAGLTEILIITTPGDSEAFKRLLGDGSQWNISLIYAQQESPSGIAQAFLIGEDFIAGDDCCLILGDNVFHGSGFGRHLSEFQNIDGAHIFAYQVANPSAYGVIEFSDDGKALSIEEKPSAPKSHFAIPGLYFYDNTVVQRTKSLSPSSRGELEITDLNKSYLNDGKLSVSMTPRGTVWLDTGTFEDLIDASNYVKTIQQRTGLMVADLDEIAAGIQ